jgi:hypothetical protein
MKEIDNAALDALLNYTAWNEAEDYACDPRAGHIWLAIKPLLDHRAHTSPEMRARRDDCVEVVNERQAAA